MKCGDCPDWKRFCANHGHCQRVGAHQGQFLWRRNQCEYEKEPVRTLAMAVEKFRQRVGTSRPRGGSDWWYAATTPTAHYFTDGSTLCGAKVAKREGSPPPMEEDYCAKCQGILEKQKASA